MDKKTSAVQEIIQSFPKYENEDDEKVHVSGARAVWSYEVYQKKPGSVQNDSVPAFEELELSDATLSIVRKNVCEGVEKLAGRNPFRVWISDILNPQLNNAVRTHPESSPWILQVLFFGEEHIAFILTLFPCDAPASEEQTATMIGFSRTTARLLMASLMNFCHTEFFLVPAALAYSETFDVERLQRDLEQQMSSASEFYGGPAKLSKTAYHELTQAVNRVMRSTSVPCALQLSPAQKPEDWLLLMDADWHKAVVHLLNMLEGILKQKITEPCHLTYEPENRTKTMITVFEIARRLSFQHKVLVVSRHEELRVPIE
ncbi:hypothetical protein V1264_015406 [Littorina saxatilis]|uniref:Uncharacterized protein n=1 Tax=Littorina saxatilis TaxID=31220 RepID=A0AAN9GGF8_9CAEN